MLKKDLVSNIVLQLEVKDVTILRTYGVSMGVGYDIAVSVYNKRLNSISYYEVHAVRQSWACIGYLRPNNPTYKYTGSCDYYKQYVREYWLQADNRALKEYYNRFSKKALEIEYKRIMSWL